MGEYYENPIGGGDYYENLSVTTLETSKSVIQQFTSMFGKHSKHRATHSKGILLTGTFKPSSEAASLSKAGFLDTSSIPISVRFSNATGIPSIADGDHRANPRGMSIKFHVSGDAHADIIAHSTPLFPGRTAEEFLQFLRAASASKPGTPHPTPLEEFLDKRSVAQRFVSTPKPTLESYATAVYYSVLAFALVNQDGKKTFVRFRIVPTAGEKSLDEAEATKKEPDFLRVEIEERLHGEPVQFHLKAQIAEEGDVVDDCSVLWPEDRRVVDLGVISLDAIAENHGEAEKDIVFNPTPTSDGFEPSGDPLFETRKVLYLTSGQNRRKQT